MKKREPINQIADSRLRSRPQTPVHFFLTAWDPGPPEKWQITTFLSQKADMAASATRGPHIEKLSDGPRGLECTAHAWREKTFPRARVRPRSSHGKMLETNDQNRKKAHGRNKSQIGDRDRGCPACKFLICQTKIRQRNIKPVQLIAAMIQIGPEHSAQPRARKSKSQASQRGARWFLLASN